MATRSSFEDRNRERRRRERLRKKRIRTAISLIAAVGVVVLVGITVSVVNNNKQKAQNHAAVPQTQSTEQAQQPMTITGYIDGDMTGSSSIDPQAAQEMTSTGQVPETAMSIPPASEENNLMTIIDESGTSKRCYLTFDDGPTTNITPQILDTLRKYNVKATFFQVASLIESNPDMARRVYEEGHLIANHSAHHEYDELYASTESFMSEIEECHEAIKNIGDGEEPFKLVRFPGGSFKSSADSRSPVKQECKISLQEAGFYYCDWNTLNGDAEGKTKNASELLAYLKDYSEGQDNLVVLMHDAAAKQATANYLGSAIEWLISEGYTFHRLDDIEYNIPEPSTEPTAEAQTDTAQAQ